MTTGKDPYVPKEEPGQAIFRNYHRYTGEARVLPGIERLPTNVSNQYTR